jgi:pyruvate formate lyase activating enzyme
MNEMHALIFDIYRGTSHDGPGLRTTVFFKGCSLCCAWCQNPEGIKNGQEIWHNPARCIGCLLCHEACKTGAIMPGNDGISIDRSKCVLCGACVRACPSRAMAFTGVEWTVDQLVKEVLKDKAYYDAFHGGVTASGGEPLVQYEFVTEFFRRLKQNGVHTALDTCGHVPVKALEHVLPYTDCVLYDIKIADKERHHYYTGQGNEQIFKNLLFIADTIRNADRNLQLWIRTPLIPGATATEENISQIGRFIKENIADLVERWELCAFNSACKSKYKKMDISWRYSETPPLKRKDADRLKEAALISGIGADKLVVSGLLAEN